MQKSHLMNTYNANSQKAISLPIAVAILTLSGVLASVQSADAHEGATGIVKQRMDAMKSMGDHAKSVGDMLKGKQDIDPTAIRSAADAFVSHGEDIPELFPDNDTSRQGSNTEALSEIWENWPAFTTLATQFTEDSRLLVQAAASLDNGISLEDDAARSIRAVFFKTVKSCSSCHERFRLDDH